MKLPREFLDDVISSLGEFGYQLCFQFSRAFLDEKEKKLKLVSGDKETYELIKESYLDKLSELVVHYLGSEWEAEVLLDEPQPPGESLREVTGSLLNPMYTFDNFVTGSGNQFAYAAALTVAQSVVTDSQRRYNPLFIYGKAGLGKTHLLQAIGNYILKKRSDIKVLYSTTEQFTNDLINAMLRKRTLEEFHNKYRKTDVLLLDDIQFIENKERTQEELFHTFNDFYEKGKQIVIASDRPPKAIRLLEERVRSRFESGLIVDVQPPDFETRKAILKKKLEIYDKVIVEEEVLDYIAQHFRNNVRELEGALKRVLAYADIKSTDIQTVVTLDIAKEALKNLIADETIDLTPKIIKEKVANYFGITVEDLISSKREKRVLYPRQIAMYLMRDLLGLPFKTIGEEFGGRDHSTVMHAYQKIAKSLTTPKVHDDLRNLKKALLGE